MFATYFSLERTWNFIVYKLTCQMRSLLVSTLATVGIMFFGFLISIWKGGTPEDFYQTMFPLVLVIGGLIVTCRIFSELRSPAQTMTFLTLPASNFEKWLGAWMITTVGITLGVTILMWLFSAVGNLVFVMIYPHSVASFFSPFTMDCWEAIRNYFFLHSFFFLGAVSFRRNVFFRTVLSGFLVFLGVMVITGILVHFLGFEFPFEQRYAMDIKFDVMDFLSLADTKFQNMADIGRVFQDYLLAPYLWGVAFLKIKEREL